ncbi:MAG: 23S rRNA (pseudouridine(1915)-N(3))-methyltransferase RlmH, partial [Anaerovoracaceae bacterium]
MNINILCIGKLKEKYWQEAVREYSKRLGKYCKLTVTELKESLLPANASPLDEENVKISEGENILSKIRPSDYVITLEIQGKSLSSPELASKIESLSV